MYTFIFHKFAKLLLQSIKIRQLGSLTNRKGSVHKSKTLERKHGLKGTPMKHNSSRKYNDQNGQHKRFYGYSLQCDSVYYPVLNPLLNLLRLQPTWIQNYYSHQFKALHVIAVNKLTAYITKQSGNCMVYFLVQCSLRSLCGVLKIFCTPNIQHGFFCKSILGMEQY